MALPGTVVNVVKQASKHERGGERSGYRLWNPIDAGMSHLNPRKHTDAIHVRVLTSSVKSKIERCTEGRKRTLSGEVSGSLAVDDEGLAVALLVDDEFWNNRLYLCSL